MNALTSRSLRVKREELAWKAARRYGKEVAEFSCVLIAEISGKAGGRGTRNSGRMSVKSRATNRPSRTSLSVGSNPPEGPGGR